MKRTISFLLILVIALTALPLTGCGRSQGFTIMKIGEFLESDDKDLSELSDSLKGLSNCDEEDYICILDSSFNDETKIPSAVEENNVVYVAADKSFVNTKAASLSIPKGVKYVGNIIPDDSGINHTIRSVTISDGSLVKDSFCNCSALEKIELNISQVSDSFCDCEALETLDISGVTRIRDSFNKCPAIETVDFPKAKILKSSFIECEALKSISLTGVEQIVDSFTDCTALESIDAPKVLELIEDSFTNCPKLASIKTMNAINRVTGSFSKCSMIQTTGFMRHAYMVKNCFDNCEQLNAVIFDGLSYIECPFENCNALKTLSCTFADCKHFVFYIDDEDSSENTEKIIPNGNGLTIKNSFNSLKGMTSANISGNIRTISNSFNNLPQLNTFKYNSLTEKSQSFENCPKLKSDVLTDKEKKEKEKEEEEEKEKEELENEPYGPGQSGLKLSSYKNKKTTYVLYKMNGKSQFTVTVKPGESTTKYFPSGRYVLKLNSAIVLRRYSKIFKFESGTTYKFTDDDIDTFSFFNPLDRIV